MIILDVTMSSLEPGHESDDFWSWREKMYQLASVLDPEQLLEVTTCLARHRGLLWLDFLRLEATLSQTLLERAARNRLTAGGADRAPDEYQRAVDAYFKSLAQRP